MDLQDSACTGAMSNIVFTPQDMLIKTNLHDRPLYYTGYIGDVKVDRMHIDPGSSISIIPKGLLHHLRIPMHRLTPTSTAISGFNSDRSYPIGKIRLKYQNWRPPIRSHLLRHRCRHFLQHPLGAPMDTRLYDRAFHAAPVLQICRQIRLREDGIC
ncbi:uncharacterized protein M6B38_191200 [Iris pallida]|uniref:Peptidase A2 domain-containing protein n=1 Tax=Iris pallida TaxID=29817 RepID=A0AAX6EFA5_IRIPA|nr:uncharacterized protein M6B38_191200 [Iris pallida]